ncbi:MAG: hypothetical protein V3T78_04425, partial [Dehalococcoidia bacterium]
MARGLALSIMDHQLDEFRNYLNGMEQYVKAQAKAVESRLEEEFKKWSGRDFSEAQEHEWTMYYQDETWPVESVFP